jgi:Ankyrin repeats (3 copies)
MFYKVARPLVKAQIVKASIVKGPLVTGPLLKGERDIWNEIVDEGQLLPAPESRPKYLETNLFDRVCPGILDPFDQPCNHCGYSFGWHRINDNHGDIDRLGNTKLHYAAALGEETLSLTTIRLLVNQGFDVSARNRSGETFMHVLKTKKFIQVHGLGGYIALLKFLSTLNFSFSQRDLHGRTIAHHVCKNGVLFSADVANNSISKILQILQILNTDMNTLDNHGFNVGDEFLQSAENASGFRLPKTYAMELLDDAVATWRRPALLQTNFRESLAKPDWTPRTWIMWLQKTNLMDWIDIHGDTPLTALLKNRRSEDQQAALANMIPKLVQLGVEVDMRDRKGHTAIAIAAIRGSLSCVQALLDSGASVKVVNYNGRDILSMASWRMKMAKKEEKTECYARILACANLIMDIQSRESRN